MDTNLKVLENISKGRPRGSRSRTPVYRDSEEGEEAAVSANNERVPLSLQRPTTNPILSSRPPPPESFLLAATRGTSDLDIRAPGMVYARPAEDIPAGKKTLDVKRKLSTKDPNIVKRPRREAVVEGRTAKLEQSTTQIPPTLVATTDTKPAEGRVETEEARKRERLKNKALLKRGNLNVVDLEGGIKQATKSLGGIGGNLGLDTEGGNAAEGNKKEGGVEAGQKKKRKRPTPVLLGRYLTYPPTLAQPEDAEAAKKDDEDAYDEEVYEYKSSEDGEVDDEDAHDEEIYDYPGSEIDDVESTASLLEDYRGDLEPPTVPYDKLDFPKPARPKTIVEKLRDVVKEWEDLVKKHEDSPSSDQDLLGHARARLKHHQRELSRAIEKEPTLKPYREERLEILRRCLERFELPEEIVNVKAAIHAFETGRLGNDMDVWTVFYNGEIVDTMNSQYELLWSVRKPLYEELYGKEGGIWIEPPANHVSKACAMLFEKHFVSGVHWYIWQNLQLPWYPSGKFAKEFEFLLDTGATDPTLFISDFHDLGMVQRNCPHVCTKNVRTANGDIEQDFYPIFINHIDRDTNKELYLPMDSIASLQGGEAGIDDRLSGLDLWRYLYVSSEPSTGVLSYTPDFRDHRLRYDINPGNTLTPRAWYTIEYPAGSQGRRRVTRQVCDLTFRKPRLLNRLGDRWVVGREYDYQWGLATRTPPKKIGYIPGHRVHPPTPDSVRQKRKAAVRAGRTYRETHRPGIARIRSDRTGYMPGRDNPAGDYDSPTEEDNSPYLYLDSSTYTRPPPPRGKRSAPPPPPPSPPMPVTKQQHVPRPVTPQTSLQNNSDTSMIQATPPTSDFYLRKKKRPEPPPPAPAQKPPPPPISSASSIATASRVKEPEEKMELSEKMKGWLRKGTSMVTPPSVKKKKGVGKNKDDEEEDSDDDDDSSDGVDTAGVLNLPEARENKTPVRGPGRFTGIGGGMDITYKEAEMVRSPTYYRGNSKSKVKPKTGGVKGTGSGGAGGKGKEKRK
ncbi:hypothetical protein DFH27DRAFT_359618 [Peziza echinospora]|nr:hypothetical protein DFH27DRAFT_359618 [Peziza echinospora]